MVSESKFQMLLDSLTYINIHSTFRPGGEIRGQIISPEPASAVLLMGGAVVLLTRRRKVHQ